MMHGHEKSDPEIVAIRTNAGGMRRENNAQAIRDSCTRCVWLDACGTKESVDALNTVIPRLWGGKTLFTDDNGGCPSTTFRQVDIPLYCIIFLYNLKKKKKKWSCTF